MDCDAPQRAIEHDWWGREPRFYADSAEIAVNADEEASAISTDSAWKDDEPLFCLYMFEHEGVNFSRGHLQRHGKEYRLELEGEAEVMGAAFKFRLSTAIAREPWR